MARKHKVDQSELIAEAALFLAGKSGWARLTLSEIAKKAGLPVKAVTSRFKNTWEILAWILAKVEKDVQSEVEENLGDNWRDNLFEILMARFDNAQRHREAFAAILPSLLESPKAARYFVRPFLRTMRGTTRLAGLPRTALAPLHLAAFSALYVSVVDAWSRDDTPDLSRTMAAVDKRLEMFERLVSFRPCARSSASPSRSAKAGVQS
jgi:AcrR family transcriptional regulator